MGVYIEGMKMPESCMVCPIYSMSEHWCDAMNRNLTHAISESTRRAEWCPLVPVPPHGRLIDADALLNLLNNCMFPSDMVTTTAVRMATNWIKDAPTIIQAELPKEES